MIDQNLVKTNGITLNVAQAGPKDGELVILLHGFPEFWYGWRHQINYLAESGFYVWAPDQRGYNLSDKPTEIMDYRVDELVNDVLGLIRTSGRQQAYLVGHDWGAMVAWWVALKRPDVIKKLTILNAPHPRVFSKALQTSNKQKLKSWYMGAFQIPFLPERFMQISNWRITARLLKSTSKKGSFTKTDIETYRRAWSQPNSMKAMINWYRAYRSFPPARPDDWQITVPVNLIWGKKDTFFGSNMVKDTMALCTNGQLTMIDNATHWVQHDEANQVNTLLHDWLV